MLADLFSWLGLDGAADARAAAEQVLREVPVHDGTNRKYAESFCKWVARDGCAGYRAMVEALEPRLLATGYSLREWGARCDAPCAATV